MWLGCTKQEEGWPVGAGAGGRGCVRGGGNYDTGTARGWILVWQAALWPSKADGVVDEGVELDVRVVDGDEI